MYYLRRIIVLLVFLLLVASSTAQASTAFLEPPPTWTDNTPLVQCDVNGEPSYCIRERRLYSSQTSFNDVAPVPQPAATMQVLAIERTSACIPDVQANLPIYVSQAVVLWDNSLVVSLPNFFIRGNLVAWEQGFVDTAVVDGLDMMKLRTLFGLTPTNPRLTWSDCPQVTGVDFPIYPRDEVAYGELNGDLVVDGLDIMIFRVLLFGLATQ
jgi:hypothetical protein